jgi:hypothetical protein
MIFPLLSPLQPIGVVGQGRLSQQDTREADFIHDMTLF